MTPITPGEVLLTRRATFCASHRLHIPSLSDEENQALFDKCNNKNGHGHNFSIEVTLKGVPDPQNGMIINLTKLKKIIHDVIITKVDHRHLNLDIEEFQGAHLPTTENLIILFWNWLLPHLPPNTLYRIRLIETENNSTEYYG